MPNLSFYYLYRDSSNYKNHNTIVFTNPDNKSIKQIQDAIIDALIDGEYFYHDSFGIQPLFFDGKCLEEDPSWHEFLKVSNTPDQPTENISITEFLERINVIVK